MKRLMMVAVALICSAAMNLTSAQGLSREPFNAALSPLSSYLQLSPDQVDEVAKINDYFIESQKDCLYRDAKSQKVAMDKVLYENLKLMKGVLSEEQYHKYVTIINVTNNNNKALD